MAAVQATRKNRGTIEPAVLGELKQAMHHIEQEHPEYRENQAMWRRYKHLYAGGEELRRRASDYLTRRSKEPPDVYFERLTHVFYENYIGTIIDWYGATLMRREAVLQFDGNNEAGKTFFATFVKDCDLRGTTLAEFFKRQLTNTLIFGSSYTAVEFPRMTEPAASRAEEDAKGRSRGYLVEYSPEQVINWARDVRGNLEWIVIRTADRRQDNINDREWKRESRWLVYDRENYQIYRREESETGSGPAIELVDSGRHGLADQHRVPVFELRVSDGMWLMNKAALLQLEHFNKSNALSWALTMGLFATPVIYSDREWNQITGESYYIQLGPNDRFGWAEPEGHVHQIAADNLSRLKDEIYRVCYLLNQASSQSSNQQQSGISKQRDFSITQEILRAYGDAVKDVMRQVLESVEWARKDGLEIDVSGLDEFDIGDFSSELSDAKNLLALGIGSETLKQQIFKRIALKYLCDVRQDVKNKIVSEIDASFVGGGQ